jgi:tRNA(Ile2) C34 agmatinyltransferase TiaS
METLTPKKPNVGEGSKTTGKKGKKGKKCSLLAQKKKNSPVMRKIDEKPDEAAKQNGRPAFFSEPLLREKSKRGKGSSEEKGVSSRIFLPVSPQRGEKRWIPRSFPGR